jgi:hypothetical protein
MNLCKDCKYFERPFLHSKKFAKCKHPRYCNPIDGSGGVYCDIVRECDSNTYDCGREGRLFQPKNGAAYMVPVVTKNEAKND